MDNVGEHMMRGMFDTRFDHELSSRQRLIVEIIRSGIEEKDFEYFNSATFTEHCRSIGLEPSYLRRKIISVLFEKACSNG